MPGWDKRREWRREELADMRARDRRVALRRFIVCVRPTAIPMPAWTAGRRIPGLTYTDSMVWLRPKDAKFLIRLDREEGGSATYAETEYRRCPVCSRPLLGADAAARRRLDESAMTGRQKPCGSECLDAAKDGRWKMRVDGARTGA